MKNLKKNSEIIRYLIVGILTTLVSLLIYYVLIYTFFDPGVALELQITNVISWLVSVSFAYVTNHFFVFQSKKNIGIKEALDFYLSRLLTLGIDMLLMYLLVSILNFNDKFIKLVVQAIIIVLNYIFSKYLVFKKK